MAYFFITFSHILSFMGMEVGRMKEGRRYGGVGFELNDPAMSMLSDSGD
jgi:predicted sugar kinase